MSTIELIKIDTIKLPIVNIRHLAILWGDLLKNPPGDCGKVSRRACVLRQHARTTRNQSIDDRHLCYSTIFEENYCSQPAFHSQYGEAHTWGKTRLLPRKTVSCHFRREIRARKTPFGYRETIKGARYPNMVGSPDRIDIRARLRVAASFGCLRK
jgi:hypothetical protein